MQPHRITQAEIQHIINLPSCERQYVDDHGGACALGKLSMVLGWAQGPHCLLARSPLVLPFRQMNLAIHQHHAPSIPYINDFVGHAIAMQTMISRLQALNIIEIIDSDISLPEIKSEQKELVTV